MGHEAMITRSTASRVAGKPVNQKHQIAFGAVTYAAILWFALFLAGSPASAGEKAGVPDKVKSTQAKTASSSPLAGTRWRLLEFQSMDDAIGTLRPGDPSNYTMHLNADGTVVMHLNCNRAKGTWSAQASGEAASGRFKFGLLATTRALCPPPSLDEQITAQVGFIRSYLLQDGRLYLNLMADGGTYAWEPVAEQSPVPDVPAAPENVGPGD